MIYEWIVYCQGEVLGSVQAATEKQARKRAERQWPEKTISAVQRVHPIGCQCGTRGCLQSKR